MPKYLMTGTECREIDQLAMSCLNLSEIQLMQRAADAALGKLVQHWPQARRISVYCGPGNNGGDGYLVAAGAKKLGYEVRLFTLGSPAPGTALVARERALAEGLPCVPITADLSLCFDPQADLIVDALFGHGLQREIGSPLQALFERINAHFIPVFALDMPSGISSDTGAVMGVAIQAAATICFVAPKIGLLTGNGAVFAGELFYDTLGIPEAISSKVQASYVWLDDDFLARSLPQPKASCHKGDFGHVAIVGGQPGMPGAVVLAALAAARSGAGRVTVISSDEHAHLLPLSNPVLMSLAINSNADFSLPVGISSLALGPGLGLGLGSGSGSADSSARAQNWSQMVYANTLKQAQEAALPILLDADGLNLLACQHRHYENWILSPHPKEAARLLDCTVNEIQSDRPQACLRIAEQYGGVCVLKGQGSLVADAGGRQAVCTWGNWGMATAGSGDVLSGMIAAMLGQGLSLFDAACVAVSLHAKAGDLAAAGGSKRSLIASDIIAYLPTAFQTLETN